MAVTIFKSVANNNSERDSEQIRKKFGTKIEATFNFIVENPDHTAEQIANALNVTSRTIENHQAKLKKLGFIERFGDKIGGFWIINI